jgi:hypothetical protein
VPHDPKLIATRDRLVKRYGARAVKEAFAEINLPLGRPSRVQFTPEAVDWWAHIEARRIHWQTSVRETCKRIEASGGGIGWHAIPLDAAGKTIAETRSISSAATLSNIMVLPRRYSRKMLLRASLCEKSI